MNNNNKIGFGIYNTIIKRSLSSSSSFMLGSLSKQERARSNISNYRTHYSYHGPGRYEDLNSIRWKERDFRHRGFTVGIGGPVGSGKTALVEQLCHLLPKELSKLSDDENNSIAVVTNDIFTQ